uniref:HMG box domain-containing protein n=1 Tax=Glossina pallidipes TaxID=7398 RepID=A0A1A9ZMV6_GLOPL
MFSNVLNVFKNAFKYQREVGSTAQKSEPQKQSSRAENKLYQESTAPTEFFVFLHEFRRLVGKSSVKNLTQAQIYRKAGKKWRQMTSEQKQPYSLWARANRNHKTKKCDCETPTSSCKKTLSQTLTHERGCCLFAFNSSKFTSIPEMCSGAEYAASSFNLCNNGELTAIAWNSFLKSIIKVNVCLLLSSTVFRQAAEISIYIHIKAMISKSFGECRACSKYYLLGPDIVRRHLQKLIIEIPENAFIKVLPNFKSSDTVDHYLLMDRLLFAVNQYQCLKSGCLLSICLYTALAVIFICMLLDYGPMTSFGHRTDENAIALNYYNMIRTKLSLKLEALLLVAQVNDG